MKIINKKKFAKAALDEHIKVFMMYVISLLTMAIHPAGEAQITLIVAEKMQILSEYSDFSDIFLEKKTLVLLAATDLNQHAIKL